MSGKYPLTRKEDVVEEIHGVRVVDSYRWLEDESSKDVQAWIEEQNEFTESVLRQYPGKETISKRLHELYEYDYIMATQFRVVMTALGPRFFYLYRKAGENQPSLCYQDGEDGTRTVLFNPLDQSEDATVAIDWFVPSSDGTLVSFGISEGGTEMSILHVMDVETQTLLNERIPRTKWCSLVWLKNSGFYYSRYPLPGTVSSEDEHYYHHVYYHDLGQDYKSDVKVFGEGRPKTEHPFLAINDNDSLLIVNSDRFISSDTHVSRIDSSNPSKLKFMPIIESNDASSIPFLHGDELYLLTQVDAPNGQVVKYDLAGIKDGEETPEGSVIVPESKHVIFSFEYPRLAVFGDKLAVVEFYQASSILKVYHKDTGSLLDEVDFKTHVTVYQLESAPGLDTFYFGLGSFFYPVSHYRYSKEGAVVLFRPDLDITPERYQSKLVWYHSKDETEVSMFVLSARDTEVSERTPVLLTGYGGFGNSLTPELSPIIIPWLERGGVHAIAHLRGGGEYGNAWHRSGNRENKQNVFDDFISAAKWLADNNIGSNKTISIIGGSNGGLLVGAALVQSPESFACVSCHVPLLDMIRYTNFSVAKTWASEYGNPEVEEEFRWLYSYSPYHHVMEKLKYPATFFHTALGDTRVDSMHAFKMAAKLQARSGGSVEENPIVLYVESKSGHGAGKPIDMVVEMYTRSLVFLAHHTGLQIE